MQFTKISRPQFLHLSSIFFLKQLYKNAPSIHSFKRTSKLTSASVQPSSQQATAYASLSPFQQPFSRWTWVSWCLLKLKVMEVVVTTGAIGRAKLQSNHHHQQTNIQFFYKPDALPVAQPSVKALKGKYHIPWTCLSQAHLGILQLCLWPLIAPGYLVGGLSCLPLALWCQYPTTAHA